MQFTTHILTLLALVLVGVLAAPTSLERRATNLQISLRETGKNTKAWHFALVIHVPGEISDKIKKVKIHEHVVSKGCMEYDGERIAATKAAHLAVTGTLHPADGETDDVALDTAAIKIMEAIPSSHILSPDGFNNCLDFAVEAVRRLNTARYISKDDYEKFQAYKDQHSAAVRLETEQHTIDGAKSHSGK